MVEEKIYEIEKVYELCENTQKVFSCTFCKKTVEPEDCKGCPIYAQSFSND